MFLKCVYIKLKIREHTLFCKLIVPHHLDTAKDLQQKKDLLIIKLWSDHNLRTSHEKATSNTCFPYCTLNSKQCSSLILWEQKAHVKPTVLKSGPWTRIALGTSSPFSVQYKLFCFQSYSTEESVPYDIKCDDHTSATRVLVPIYWYISPLLFDFHCIGPKADSV